MDLVFSYLRWRELGNHNVYTKEAKRLTRKRGTRDESEY
jgi:hypothetical protein